MNETEPASTTNAPAPLYSAADQIASLREVNQTLSDQLFTLMSQEQKLIALLKRATAAIEVTDGTSPLVAELHAAVAGR